MIEYTDEEIRIRRTSLQTSLEHLEQVASWHRAALDEVGSTVLAVAKRSPPPPASNLPQLHYKRELLSEWRAKLASAAGQLPIIRERLALLNSGIARLCHFNDIADTQSLEREWHQRRTSIEHELANLDRTVAKLDSALHQEIFEAQSAVHAAQQKEMDARRQNMFKRWGVGKG